MHVVELVLSVLLSAQPRTITATRVQSPPVIDGKIEGIWQTGDSAFGFTRRTPRNGSAAIEATTVYVLYDELCIYVAFKCYATDVKSIRGNLVGPQDQVAVYLDPFADRFRCHVFEVSASGDNATYRLIEDGRYSEYWEGIWRSAVAQQVWGYSVEMAIPLSSLRHERGKEVWRIDFRRTVVSRNEETYWCPHGRTDFRVSRMGTLTGLHFPMNRVRGNVNPTLRLQQVRQWYYWIIGHDSIRLSRNTYSLWPGVDGTIAPVSNVALLVAAHPDPADADAVQPLSWLVSSLVRASTATSVYDWLPERRPLFCEESDLFAPDLFLTWPSAEQLSTRSVGRVLPDGGLVPVDGATKFVGTFGGTTLGVLGAHTGQRSYEAWGYGDTQPASWHSAAAVRQRLFGFAELGLTYAGEDNAETCHHAATLGGRIRAGNAYGRIAGAWSRADSVTSYGGATQAWYETDGVQLDASLQHRTSGSEDRTTWASVYGGPQFYDIGPIGHSSIGLDAVGGLDRYQYGDSVNEYKHVYAGVSASAEFLNRFGAYGYASTSHVVGDSVWNMFCGVSANTDDRYPLVLTVDGQYYRSYDYLVGALRPTVRLSGALDARAGKHISLRLAAEGSADLGKKDSLSMPSPVLLCPSIEVTTSPGQSAGIAAAMERMPRSGAASTQYYWDCVFGLSYNWRLRSRSTQRIVVLQQLDIGQDRTVLGNSEWLTKLTYMFSF